MFQVHQVEMEGVVRGIQADMIKLSKNHSHTSNTVSKLLDKSRRLSVTMKEVSERIMRLSVNTPVDEMSRLPAVVAGARQDGASGRPGEEAGGQSRTPDQQEQLQSPHLPGGWRREVGGQPPTRAMRACWEM